MEVTKLFKFVSALMVSQNLEPAELHPRSAKKAKATPAEGKVDDPDDKGPPQELPQTLPLGQPTQVIGNPFVPPSPLLLSRKRLQGNSGRGRSKSRNHY